MTLKIFCLASLLFQSVIMQPVANACSHPIPFTSKAGVYQHKTILVLVATLMAGCTLNYYLKKTGAQMKLHEAQLICLNENTENQHTIYLFAHGLDPRKNGAVIQANSYIRSGIIDTTCYTFCFNDELQRLNFAQKRDCNILAHAYDQVLKKHPESNIVLVGISRGATAILNMLSTHSQVDFSHIKAVVLESPFDHMDTVTQHLAQSYVPLLPLKLSHTILHKLLRSCTQYDMHGVHAIHALDTFPEHIPVFIGYTQEDKTVPPASTHSLITKLHNLGRSITHWVSESGRHSALSKKSDFAREVQNFLKKHVR